MKDFCDEQLQVFCQDLTYCQKVVFIKVASNPLAQVSIQKPVKLKKLFAMFSELRSLLPNSNHCSKKSIC